MARTIKFAVLLAAIVVVAFLVKTLRSTTSATSELGGTGELAGSLDTWPEVPVKKVA